MSINRRSVWLGSGLSLLVFVLLNREAQADSTRVTFFNGTWKQVLVEAKRFNKPIFLDVYTTWCGPCKQMEQEAFPNPQVARLFNANFINYRVDAERGEGKLIAQTFEVTAYPTLLFVDASGSVIYRIVGYSDKDDLLRQANKVLTVSQTIGTLPKPDTLSEKLKHPAYVQAYLLELAKLRQPAGELLNKYVAKLSDDELTSPENLSIMAGTVSTTRSKAFDVLLRQLPTIKDSPTGREALITLPLAVASDFKRVVASGDEQAFLTLKEKNRELLQTIGTVAPEMVDQELLLSQLDFYRQTERYDQYHQLASFYAATQLMNQSIDSLQQQDRLTFEQFNKRLVASDSLRQTAGFKRMTEAMKHRVSESVALKLIKLAGDYQTSITNPIYLNEALSWSERAVVLCPTPFYQKTHAQMLYKVGRRKEAISEQRQAIEASKVLGNPAEELEETLVLMQGGKL